MAIVEKMRHTTAAQITKKNRTSVGVIGFPFWSMANRLGSQQKMPWIHLNLLEHRWAPHRM